jgi:type VI secretion system protein ImpL
MKTALKIALAILLLALLGLGILWLSLARQWPWWVGVALFLGILGLVALVVVLIHHARRRRERKFVQRVIAEDTSAIHNAPINERQALQDLQSRWAEAIDLLRHSFLRKQGNPLYVLPWYLVIGESGAGKTSAITRSGLSSILGERRRVGPIASTRNCDWWFFEQAIILDTAGRYTIPIDEGPDKEEWKRFLTLLAQYRRREPINGVVVVVPADQIQACDTDKLREDALDIRRRLDHLMRSLGAKVPIYLMVTKMDRVLGMTAFAETLGDRTSQAMGFTNAAKDPHWKQVLAQTMDTVGQRLRELRFDLVREQPSAGPGLLLFPSEFEKLRPGLEQFVGPLFQETQYLESPILRGIFFSSAAPGGQPTSAFLREFGLQENLGVRLRDGVFLKEFFATVLPRDRHLHQPIREFLEWARVRRNLAYLTWCFLWLGALGMLGAAFTQNIRAISGFSAQWKSLPQLSDDVGKNLLQVDRMRLEVISMKRTNRNWWIPRFGLDQSLLAEKVAQDAWLGVFRGGLLSPLDAVESHLADADNPAKNGWVGAYTGHLVTRMALLQSIQDRPDMDLDQPPPILESFTKASADLLIYLHPGMSKDMANLYGQNYLAGVLWYDNATERSQKLGELRWNLARVMARNDNDLRWIADSWIPMAPAVELADFWGQPERTLQAKPIVPGAFTLEGRKNIQAFTKLLGNTLYESQGLKGKVAQFWDWYGQQFNASWLAFAKRFGDGDQGMTSASARQRMATLMATPQNPYFKLLSRMAQEEGGLQDPAPATWAVLLGRLSRVRELAAQQLLEKSNASTLDKLDLERQKQLQTWEGKLDPKKAQDFDLCMAASKSWLDYLAALQDVTPTLLSKATARRQMLQCFGGGDAQEGDQGTGASPFLKAHGSVLAMEILLRSDSACKLVWDLVRGPLNHTMAFSLDETATLLQEQWEQTVLSSLREKDPGQLHKVLFNPADGKVWAFLKGPAKPFVMKTDSGYIPRRAFSNQTLPFMPDFFNFLKSAEDGELVYQTSFTVTLETLPLEVNPGAMVTPTGSRLCLQTPDSGRTCLENFNFNQSAVFKWEPETSGEASLHIQLPSLTLTRTWPGPSGFALFLKDLATGTRSYAASEFPEAEDKLRALGITWIRVAYRIQGGDKVLRYLRRTPTQVPLDIVAIDTED